MRGRYVRWYSEALRDIFCFTSMERRGNNWDIACLIELWRLSGFTPWDRKRVEALKRLSKFEVFETGFLQDRLRAVEPEMGGDVEEVEQV